jgi:hypothetical protein
MTSKVSGRWPAECGMPTAAKLTNVEITQARNLDVERRAVWQCRTDLYARHDAQDWGEAVLPRSPLAISRRTTFNNELWISMLPL